MAKSVIYSKDYKAKDLRQKSYPISSISNIDVNSKIIDKSPKTRSIKTKTYPISNIVSSNPTIKIKDTLPFRVRLTSLGVSGYGANNIPGIGIQVIGYSNYII
jgi:hypothetical protein